MELDDSSTRWSWRGPDPAQNRHLNLLYEPGNWGDVLKGIWAARLTRELCRRLPEGRPLRYFDPFAGAPEYPLVPAAGERLRRAPAAAAPFLELQGPWLQRGRLGSTASLVMAAAALADRRVEASVYDLDPARRDAWRLHPVRVLEHASGEEALDAAPPPDLLLLDPYDLFDAWGSLLKRALLAARGGPVLAYLYNKAPRGGGYVRQYEQLRRGFQLLLDKGDPAKVLVGRIPADPSLPRAWHELLLCGPPDLVQAVAPELERATRELAAWMASEGSFESS